MENEIKLSLKGLDCANCANKIEKKVNELAEVEEAILNFSISRIGIKIKEDIDRENLIIKIKQIVNELEPDVIVSEYKSPKVNNSTIKRAERNNDNIKLDLIGLDCANCANKIEERVKKLEEIKEASLNFSMGTMILKLNNGFKREQAISNIENIVNELEPDVLVRESKEGSKNKLQCNDEHCNCSSQCKIDNDNEEVEEDGFFKKNILLISGVILYALAMIIKKDDFVSIILFLISYILVGGKIVKSAIKNITKGEIFDENFLMSIATIGALLIGEYPEAVAVMIFYEIGELFQGYAVNRSRSSITSLMNIRADYANLLNESGEEIKVNPEQINVNDIIVIKPGERVPLDGIVIEGAGLVDTSALTGESMPRGINTNDEVLSGSINLNSVIKVKVTKVFGESTISRILEMVENAGSKKAKTEKFITKFCRYYTPIVVFSAIAVALIPPIIIKEQVFSVWLYRALSFLVVSCPCALVVSIPLGLFSGIGAASRRGILVKGGNYLEALKDVDTVVFDKTGTLTRGTFKVSEINCIDISKDDLLEIAALGESFSSHPIAQSIVREYGKDIDKDLIENYKELSGYGISAEIKGKAVLLGNYKLMKDRRIEFNESDSVGTVVYIAVEGKYAGNIIIEDEIKDESKEAIQKLKQIGIREIVMLTGDNEKVAKKVGRELDIDVVHAELLPMDKVDKVEQLLGNKKRGKLIFVGDGINDAPVLARADIGVAMGGIGSDAAIEAADVVLMKDSPLALRDAIIIGRKTNKILWQNIVFSLVIKIGALILISFGVATMWEAVFADVGVTLLAVLNSMRALKIK